MAQQWKEIAWKACRPGQDIKYPQICAKLQLLAQLILLKQSQGLRRPPLNRHGTNLVPAWKLSRSTDDKITTGRFTEVGLQYSRTPVT